MRNAFFRPFAKQIPIPCELEEEIQKKIDRMRKIVDEYDKRRKKEDC